MKTEHRNQLIREAQARFRPDVKDFSHDHGLPTRPVGHASGVATSRSIVRSYRKDHRRDSANVEPQQVIDVLNEARIERWVLMGLYGYVGYLAQPRATQDVDILVAQDDIERVIAAIEARWPKLQTKRREVVVRFLDPGEVAIDGEVKQVIDVMLPSNACYAAILNRHHRIDEATGHRIPILEGAIASKYAALVSPNRDWDKKSYDAGDLRSMMVPNQATIDRQKLHQLGELIFPGGGDELLEFLELAIHQKPFPI